MQLKSWAAGLLVLAGTVAVTPADARRSVRHFHRAPMMVGACVRTRVADIGTMVLGGPVIRYADGVVQALDGDLAGQTGTRPGDPVRLCLVSRTQDCGDQDGPGRTYAVGNLRTGAAWTSPDVRLSCGPR